MGLACLLLSTCTLGRTQPAYDATSDYSVREVEGFTVRVNQRLLDERPEAAGEALQLLAAKLLEVRRVVPAGALAALRTVPIWVEAEDPHGRHLCMCYHPSREWLGENGYNPDKARCVEVANIGNFLSWSREQPAMVFHELAHAYHHQVLGYDDPTIKQAYERAKESGAYESVLYYDGKLQRAYAMNNDQEYFAELTEAYFGTNDFYPFVRPEVEQFDLVGFAMLKSAWERPAAK
ncbi:MAG: hypothetical protein FJX75_05470 [Armatimonadetes bacterium]|nr:hypothetical protein [Armatimonadota bacterium]